MKKPPPQHLRVALGCALALLMVAHNGRAQTTAFTYQGSLTIGGALATGSYDLQFKLYDQLAGGAPQGSPSTVTVSGVTVTGGVFSVDLDFGATAFPGAARYLEISVRPAGSGSFTTLTPRQQLTSTPYAIRSLSAASADTATTATSATTATTATSAATATSATNFTGSLSGDVTGTQGATVVSMVGGVSASNVASGATLANNATNANTPGTIVKRDASGNFSAGTVTATNFSGGGANLTNLNASNLVSGTLSDFLLSSNVAKLNTAQTFTADQTVAASLFQSGTLVQFTPTNGFVVGGAQGTGSIPATGKGVRMMWYPNKAAFRAGALSQGGDTYWDDSNIGLGSVAFGGDTLASGQDSFAAGFHAWATGDASFAFGYYSVASGSDAVALGSCGATGLNSACLGGGTASGFRSLATGLSTTASGDYTTAMGRYASTNGMKGSFAYGDASTTGNLISATVANQFNVRAAGGLRFFASSDTSDTTKPGMFISGTTGNTQINGDLTVSGSISGGSITNLNAGNITSGVLGIANGGTGSSTQNFVDLSSNQTSIGGNKTFTGTVTASTFSGGGSNLTSLNANNISSGTLSDARLSSNVALKSAANTFTADQTINANLIQSGTLAQFTATDGFVAKGTFSSGSIPATGKGARMMWYPGEAAFRAGYVAGTQWDTPGTYSTAFGYNARADGSAAFAAGYAPSASGDESVAIGDGATASGTNSVAIGTTVTASQLGAIAVGFETTASGHHSTAMGSYASANGKNGGFIYGDLSTTSDISATVDNQFAVRAQQFWLGTNNNVTSTSGRFLETSTGAYLTTGGAWTNSSSRALKTNFAAVNPRDMLRKVLQLPIQTWNYKAEDARVRHIGAISQDFRGLFGFGDSAETISTVDADGVAMAAIQGLHEELKDRDAKIERLEQQVIEQQARAGQLDHQVKQQQAVIEGMRKLLCAQQPQAEVCQKQ